MLSPDPPIPIGRRIHVWGSSGSGKTTLGARLAQVLDVPFVELDALNWLPDWVGLNETDPEELVRRMRDATARDAWVVAGSYTRFSQRTFWPRLQTLVWIDLPMPLLMARVLKRSWRRWRSKETLWGTNHERFWPQLMFWSKDSLLWWIATRHARRRRDMLAYSADPKWSHIRFVRLGSVADVEAFARALEAATNTTQSSSAL